MDNNVNEQNLNWASDVTTQGIRIRVYPFYVPERSNESQPLYFFAYRVLITNVGQNSAVLKSREWKITDGNAKNESVIMNTEKDDASPKDEKEEEDEPSKQTVARSEDDEAQQDEHMNNIDEIIKLKLIVANQLVGVRRILFAI